MLRAYEYGIYPTDEQKVLFAKTFGCCRFVYNWALNLKITVYKERKDATLHKQSGMHHSVCFWHCLNISANGMA